MKQASLNGVSIWAISATAVALVLAGILIGQQLERTPPEIVSNSTATQPGAVNSTDPYSVPQWIEGMPFEWHSEVTDTTEGIAILLDYRNRELLIDHCTHPGFYDLSRNLPLENRNLECERILTSRILSFDENGAHVRAAKGNDVHVGLKPIMESNLGKLDIRVHNIEARLLPGQTNDLNQALIRVPRLAKEREALGQFMLQKELQKRANRNAARKNRDTPRFSIPASVLEQQQAERHNDELMEQSYKESAQQSY